MEALEKGRKPLREQLRRLVAEVEAVLQKPVKTPEDLRVLRINQELLQKVNVKLESWDEKIMAQMASDKATDEKVEVECKKIEEFNKIFIGIRGDIEEFNARQVTLGSSETTSVNSEKKKKYVLPEIKLKTFSGNLKDWLGWWSQFRHIHEDDDLRTHDKFMYLLQSMEPKSEARRIVESFPMMESNYVTAVEALRQRFGRNDLLLQVYLRELQAVVIGQASGQKKLPLAEFYVEIVSHLQSLAALKLDKADPAIWLFPLVESGLPKETLKAWQRSHLSKPEAIEVGECNGDLPKKNRLDCLMEFILSEVESNQQIELAKQAFPDKKPQPGGKSGNNYVRWRSTADVPTAAGLFVGQAPNCGFCDKNHNPNNCYKAQKMSMDELYQVLREKKLCFACGKAGHNMHRCNARCQFCNGKHLDIICKKKPKTSFKRGRNDNKEAPEAKRSREVEALDDGRLQVFTQHANQCSGNILLNTLKVNVYSRSGQLMTVRLLEDSASQRSFVTTDVIKQALVEPAGEEYLQTVLFGGEVPIPQRYLKKEITLVGMNGVSKTIELLQKTKLTGRINEIPTGPWISELKKKGITLSDVGYNASEADILIGNDYWGAIRTGKMFHLDCGLVAEETIFGWTLGGPISNVLVSVATARDTAPVLKTSPPQDIEKLWNLESLGIRDPVQAITLKDEEERALKHFNDTVRRDEKGRYIVALPWKHESRTLPNNRQVAIQRLKSSTYKLLKSEKFADYDGVFKNWQKEDLIEKVPEDAEVGHLIPHRPVFKESTTTPVRPVYDASCRQGRNNSLNDCLYKGPNLIEYIPSMMLRFGEKKIGVTADIRKAFQMLKVREEDRKFLCFLWWEDETCKKIITYQHNRVVFGVTSSPFLLGATIKYHLTQCNHELANALMSSYYVDNLLMSVDGIGDYEYLKSEATKIMNLGKMELRQWASSMKNEIDEPDEVDETVQILGLEWNRNTDMLSCNIKKLIINDAVTKRIMLSAVAQVFDPMGYLAPALLIPKTIIQETWSRKCGWDDPAPSEIASRFTKFLNQLPHLGEVKLPRYCKIDNPQNVTVLICADSSKIGMAAVAFLRTESEAGVKLQFLLCKSRLTPMHKISIPRSELVSCVIAVRIARVISEALGISMEQFLFFSDSSTALA